MPKPDPANPFAVSEEEDEQLDEVAAETCGAVADCGDLLKAWSLFADRERALTIDRAELEVRIVDIYRTLGITPELASKLEEDWMVSE